MLATIEQEGLRRQHRDLKIQTKIRIQQQKLAEAKEELYQTWNFQVPRAHLWKMMKHENLVSLELIITIENQVPLAIGEISFNQPIPLSKLYQLSSDQRTTWVPVLTDEILGATNVLLELKNSLHPTDPEAAATILRSMYLGQAIHDMLPPWPERHQSTATNPRLVRANSIQVQTPEESLLKRVATEEVTDRISPLKKAKIVTFNEPEDVINNSDSDSEVDYISNHLEEEEEDSDDSAMVSSSLRD